MITDATDVQVKTHGTHCISSWKGDSAGLPVCSSWGQAVQYLDPLRVEQVRLFMMLFSLIPAVCSCDYSYSA